MSKPGAWFPVLPHNLFLVCVLSLCYHHHDLTQLEGPWKAGAKLFRLPVPKAAS